MDRPETFESAGPAAATTTTTITTTVNNNGSNHEEPDPVISPTSADANVVARFEFDSVKGNDGTKVLLVQWDCDPEDPDPPAERCEVTWEGKPKILTVSDSEIPSTRRLLCLLPPTATVPPTISISRPGRPHLHAKSLPAIFAPGLGGPDAPEAGRRGVLHTLFGRARLSTLEDEMAREAKENTESVAIEMALQEKEWIIDYFGIPGDKKVEDVKPTLPPLKTSVAPAPIHPNTQSPMSMRMTEKLKGLKLATSPEGLAAAASEAKSKPPQPAGVPGLVPVVGFTPMNSTGRQDDDDDGELFALPMSPRSPEMKRSPFSVLS